MSGRAALEAAGRAMFGAACAGRECISTEEEQTIKTRRDVTITIVGATGLRASGWVPSPEHPYCICTVSIGEKELYCTEAIKDAVEPRWQERVTFLPLDLRGALCFTIMDVETESVRPAGRGSKDVLLSTMLSIDECTDCGFIGDLPVKQVGDGPMPSLRIKMRPLDGDYPEPPPMESTINAEKKRQEKVGLDLHVADGVTARVAAVQEGPFYPTRLPEGVELRPGDYIVSVNGTGGNAADMVAKMKAERSLEVKVRKPVEFGVVMDLQEAGHGLNVSTAMVHNCLLVSAVRKGAVQNWNDSNPKQVAVKPRDRLVAISGERGKADYLMKALSLAVESKDVCLVTFVRPADPETTWWLY